MSSFASDSILAVWVFLPAGIANMTPIFSAHLPIIKHWQAPLDFGITYRNKRLLGRNKTIRGLLTGMIAAGLFALLQASLQRTYASSLNIANNPWVIFAFGVSLGFGALIGDAIESFFKRQRNISSGKSWFPFDQTDYIIGGIIPLLIWSELNSRQYVIIFCVYFGLHLLVSYIGYQLKLKKSPI